MNVMRLSVVCLALVTLASLPCVIAWVIVNTDQAADRAGNTVAKLRNGTPTNRPIEHTAALLRSLSGQLAVLPIDSASRRATVLERYDAVLRQACTTLEVPQYLNQLTGLDAAAERLRIEGVLEERGLILRGAAPGHDTQGRA